MGEALWEWLCPVQEVQTPEEQGAAYLLQEQLQAWSQPGWPLLPVYEPGIWKGH